MTKHLADRRVSSEGGRLKHFLRIARDWSERAWRVVFQRALTRSKDNRRAVEYVRIERHHQE